MVRPAPGAILIEDSRTSVCLVGPNAGDHPYSGNTRGSNARIMLGPLAPDKRPEPAWTCEDFSESVISFGITLPIWIPEVIYREQLAR